MNYNSCSRENNSFANKKIKLCMITKNMILNGISTVVSSYCDNLSADKYEISILTGEEISEKYINKYEGTNVKIIRCPSKDKDKVGYYRAIYKYLKRNKTDIVHVHGNSGVCAIELMIAKLCGVKKRVMHSHNTTCDHTTVHMLLKPLLNVLCTDKCACGMAAGKWLYYKKFVVVPNSFDTKHFEYDQIKRDKVRETLGIKDEVVICHVGLFNYQKNHPYLIEIYNEYAENHPASKLLLVGEGEDKERIEGLASKSKYGGNIIFYGKSTDASEIYSAADVFILPSRFEGLPLVLLEAQISGLPCLVSDKVTREAYLGGDVEWLSILDDPRKWSEKIHVMPLKKRNSFINEHIREVSKYEIRNTVEILEDIYSSIDN